MECDIESVRKILYEQLALIEKQADDLEFQIAREMAGQVRLTAPEIKFFLTALKKGDPDTAKHKKTLIAIFVNAIYLYDDKITLIFNSGDKPVTITIDLLNDIEKQAGAVPVGERFVYETNSSTKWTSHEHLLFQRWFRHRRVLVMSPQKRESRFKLLGSRFLLFVFLSVCGALFFVCISAFALNKLNFRQNPFKCGLDRFFICFISHYAEGIKDVVIYPVCS